jgi:ankyrin repeat protein
MPRRFNKPNQLLIESIGARRPEDRIFSLIKRSSNLNKKLYVQNLERTPVSEAILMGSLPILTMLIQYGADPFLPVNGLTPLQIATQHNHVDIINKLNSLTNWSKIKQSAPTAVNKYKLNQELIYAPPKYPVGSFQGGVEYHKAREHFENGFGRKRVRKTVTVNSDIVYLRSL